MPTINQKIVPHLWFDRDAIAAAEFYCSIFPDSEITSRDVLKNTPSGDAEMVVFNLSGQEFRAISAGPLFQFNESISFQIYCADQAEVDHYWQKLSADPSAEQCGWLKDKYGLSWQIIPAVLGELMGSGDAEKTARVTQAFLKMKKLEIAGLREAFEGE